MADTGLDDRIGASVRAIQVQIANMIKGPSVVQRLYGILLSGQINDIVRLYQRSDSRATFTMIEYLLQSRSPGKWQAFIEALQGTGYLYIISLIDGSFDNTAQHVKKILQVFAPYLELQINPECLVDTLRAGNALGEDDVQELLACQTQNGAIAASAVLLNRLQTRLSPNDWYLQFLKVLYKKGYETIVHDMEPDFTLDCEILKCPALQENTLKQDDNSENANNLEEVIRANLDLLKDEVVEKIELRCVLPHLTSELFHNGTISTDLLEIDKTSHSHAVKKMIHEINQLKLKCKWSVFVGCLRRADYPDIAQRLISERPNSTSDSCTEGWIIGIYNAIIVGQIDPSALVAHLVAEDLINDNDSEQIQATNREHGCKRAAGLLIQRMQCRQSPRQWYTVFLKTLIKCQHEDLAKMIDPDFYEKFMLQQTSTVFGSANEELCSNVSALKELEELVSKREQGICCMMETVKRRQREYSKQLENMEAESVKEIKDIELKLLHPIEQSRILFKRYREGEILDIDYLKREVEKNLLLSKADRVILAPSSKLVGHTKLVTLKTINENKNCSDEKFLREKPPLSTNISRQRKDSLESFSSNTTGYLEITGTGGDLSQSCTSDPSSDSSRGPSPCQHTAKVSFKEPINDCPALAIQENMRQKIIGHTRSSSLSDLQNISKVATCRRRTLSETTINEEQDENQLNDTHRSKSFDGSSWISKSDIQTDCTGDQSYNTKYTETKPERKRLTSESNSVISDSSIWPLSTSSQDTLSGNSTFTFQVSDITSGTSAETLRSLILHGKYCMKTGRYFFTDVCASTSDEIIVVDHKGSNILIFDSVSKRFRRIFTSSGNFKPYKIVWFESNDVYILLKRLDGITKLNKYNVRFGTCNKANFIVHLEFSVNVTFMCSSQIADIKGSGDELAVACFDKHVHIIENAQELRVLTLEIDLTEWWPNSFVLHKKYIFVFDLYSQKLYCFDKCDGVLQRDWLFPKDESIEGVAFYGSMLYLAQNQKHKVVVLDIGKFDTSMCMTIWSEDVKYPYALCSTKTGLLMTQFHENQHKINRTVKRF